MGGETETGVERFVVWNQEAERETLDAAERVFVRRAVADAGAPCQHCGAKAWEIVEIRAGPEAEYTRRRVLVCGSCMTIAHRWSAGRRRKHARADPDLQAWRQDQRDRPSSLSEIIEQAGFLVYGLDRSLLRAVVWRSMRARTASSAQCAWSIALESGDKRP